MVWWTKSNFLHNTKQKALLLQLLQYSKFQIPKTVVKASLVPRPSPSFPSLAVRLYRTASDGKLGEGLGTRLGWSIFCSSAQYLHPSWQPAMDGQIQSTFYISLRHVVMVVEGFTPMLYPLSALYTTCINFPVLATYSHMCFVFAHP